MQRIPLTIMATCYFLAALAQDSTRPKKWTYHFQLTAIEQGHPAFRASYSGNNSLISEKEKAVLSVTSTLYLGRKLWKGAAIYFNPELAGGSGISSAKGIAGFANGEAFRIGDPSPTVYVARLYLQQHIALPHSGYEMLTSEANQLKELIPTSRVSIHAGKFGVSDFFDLNSYSHDPRSQFFNWSLMSNGAWDYPANTRGYTSGIIVELVKPGWAIRAGSVQVPKKANGPKMDTKIGKARGETIEMEKNWKGAHAGAIRLLLFRNQSQAPTYRNTIAEVKRGDSSSVPVYTGEYEWKRYGGVKYGAGINTEMAMGKSAGVFLRASLNDGKSATWAYTEIDRSLSLGLHLGGNGWKRSNDELGLALAINGLSKPHREFLQAGLYGFIIGDGALNYRPESILEAYYLAHFAASFGCSVDYQFVNSPAYNKDRGPAHVFAVRVHIEL